LQAAVSFGPMGEPAQSMPVPRSRASQAWVAGLQTRKTLGDSIAPDAGCALSRAYPLRQRATVMLAMVAVLPDSLRAFWAAWSSTPLLHRAAAADGVVVEEDEAVGGGVVVVARAAVEAGAPAEPS
jgi:hypothetical protein